MNRSYAARVRGGWVCVVYDSGKRNWRAANGSAAAVAGSLGFALTCASPSHRTLPELQAAHPAVQVLDEDEVRRALRDFTWWLDRK